MHRKYIMFCVFTCTFLDAYRKPHIPILGAARLGSEKLTYESLCRGENPNQQDEFGNTPLHYAVFFESKEVTNLLLAYHAQPNAQNNKGKTPLHIAVQKGNDYLARRLMKYGANPNLQDRDGDTPLHIVARYTERKHTGRLVRDLLRYGANARIKNNAGETPLELAKPLRIKTVVVHAKYKQKKERKKILEMLNAGQCYRPYKPLVKRPVRMYKN